MYYRLSEVTLSVKISEPDSLYGYPVFFYALLSDLPDNPLKSLSSKSGG